MLEHFLRYILLFGVSLTSGVIIIEQKCGPHVEHKWASLTPSTGEGFAVKCFRFFRSRPRLNWPSQRNSMRALESVVAVEPPDDLPNCHYIIISKKGGRHQATTGECQNFMSKLLPKELEAVLPKIRDQEGNKNPNVYAVFQFSLSGWAWLVTEGDTYGDDFCFFGYVVGIEREWGYFCLRELETVNIDGIKVCRDEDHVPKPLSECLKQYGFAEN